MALAQLRTAAKKTITRNASAMAADIANVTLAALDELKIEYEVIQCDPALADTREFCAHYGYALSHSANVIVAAGKTEPKCYAACVLLATTRLDVNRSVRKRLGVSRASFASADETRALTDMEIGGVTPFGLPELLPLWIDQRVMELDYVLLGGGSRAIKIKIAPRVFRHMPNATIVEGLAKDPT